MAPENPPCLVIFDASIQENELIGPVRYIEASPGEYLRVRWNVNDQPDDFKPMGNGVVYVYTKNTKIIEVPISSDAKPANLGDFRYHWSEGLQFGIPSLMFVLILPENYTLLNSQPLLAGVKNFNKRIAAYWVLEGDNKSNRTQVKWQTGIYTGDLNSEIIRINNISFAEETTDIYVGELGKAQKKELLDIHIKRVHELEKRVALQGISVDPSVTIEIDDIKKKIEKLKNSLESK
jgi:hypothetical protein